MEYKNFEIKFNNKLKDEHGYITGYASIFNIKDKHGDVIKSGAFLDSIKSPENIKFLWQHNPQEPIGTWINIQENDVGLLVEGMIPLNIQKGIEAYSMLEQGIVNGLSIGFFIKDYEYDYQDNIRYIKKVDLLEISIVTFPANNQSIIHNVSKYLHSLQPLYDSVQKALYDLKKLFK